MPNLNQDQKQEIKTIIRTLKFDDLYRIILQIINEKEWGQIKIQKFCYICRQIIYFGVINNHNFNHLLRTSLFRLPDLTSRQRNWLEIFNQLLYALQIDNKHIAFNRDNKKQDWNPQFDDQKQYEASAPSPQDGVPQTRLNIEAPQFVRSDTTLLKQPNDQSQLKLNPQLENDSLSQSLPSNSDDDEWSDQSSVSSMTESEIERYIERQHKDKAYYQILKIQQDLESDLQYQGINQLNTKTQNQRITPQLDYQGSYTDSPIQQCNQLIKDPTLQQLNQSSSKNMVSYIGKDITRLPGNAISLSSWEHLQSHKYVGMTVEIQTLVGTIFTDIAKSFEILKDVVKADYTTDFSKLVNYNNGNNNQKKMVWVMSSALNKHQILNGKSFGYFGWDQDLFLGKITLKIRVLNQFAHFLQKDITQILLYLFKDEISLGLLRFRIKKTNIMNNIQGIPQGDKVMIKVKKPTRSNKSQLKNKRNLRIRKGNNRKGRKHRFRKRG